MNEIESATLVKLLPPEMQQALEEAARSEKRRPGELVEEAVRQFLKDRHWRNLLSHGKGRARALGRKSSDVNRLIAEYRRETMRPKR
jgi:metal-responsive CopG/Arc/MetJ family transcriptional regulator